MLVWGSESCTEVAFLVIVSDESFNSDFNSEMSNHRAYSKNDSPLRIVFFRRQI